MMEMKFNNCLLLNIHKDLSDTLDLVSVAKIFLNNDKRKNIFNSFS